MADGSVRDGLLRCLADLEARQEAIGKAIMAVRTLIENADALADVPALPGVVMPGGHAGQYTGRHRDRVVRFLLDSGNRPATNREIRQAVGISRGSVANLTCAKTPAGYFEKVGEYGSGERVRWKLTDTKYAELRGTEAV